MERRRDAVADEREAALARRAAGGQADAFGELVRRYEAPLFRFLLVRCGSREDAEELCQESFLRAWSRIDRYDPSRRFSTWLFTLAHRLAVSRLRAAPPRTADAQVDALGVRHEPEREALLRERREGIWGLAGRVLTVEQRTALWLRYAEGLGAAEIGRVLGRRAPAVRVLLHRARALLAEHLDPSLAHEAAPPTDRAVLLPPLHDGHALEGGS
jgi:RNA polymerase sigma-70 factor (ECF subfamily)